MLNAAYLGVRRETPMLRENNESRYPIHYLGILGYVFFWAACYLAFGMFAGTSVEKEIRAVEPVLICLLGSTLLFAIYWNGGLSKAPKNIRGKYIALLLSQIPCLVALHFNLFLYVILSLGVFIYFLYFATSRQAISHLGEA